MCLLLIDDDFDDRELFREALNEISPTLKCVTSTNVDDALKALRSSEISRPELIFLDLLMPKVDGFQCLSELKADGKLSNIPVIIYTCSNLEKDIQLTLELGATNYITKPFPPQKICYAIRFFLRLYNLVE